MILDKEQSCDRPLAGNQFDFSIDFGEQIVADRRIVDWDAYDEMRFGLLPHRSAWLGRLPRR